MSDEWRRVAITQVSRTGEHRLEDAVAVEEPLQVRLHGKPFAVIMRTPGDDRDLAAGFLLSEGILAGPADLGAIEQCRHPRQPEFHNTVDVFLAGPSRGAAERLVQERRNVMTNSSCGLCGRVTVESLKRTLPALPCSWAVSADTIAALPPLLRREQRLFEQTGGLHGAALFAPDGSLLGSAEDVGRHNAVDKVIGRMLLADRLPLDRALLAVSGRASFEIVQKAWIAGIAIVCAVSAPSSLAVDLADAAGMTLLGFVRNGGFNIYSHAERVHGCRVAGC